MTPRQIKIEARGLKADKMQIKKIIEKLKESLSDIGEKNMCEVLKHQNVLKIKIRDRTMNKYG